MPMTFFPYSRTQQLVQVVEPMAGSLPDGGVGNVGLVRFHSIGHAFPLVKTTGPRVFGMASP